MDPANEFSAKGFLGMAKGPTKGFYYMFLPDLTGDERLQMAEVYKENTKENGEKTHEVIAWTFPVIEQGWLSYYQKFVKKYGLSDEQKAQTDAIVEQYLVSLREYTMEKREEIRGFLGSKARYEKSVATEKNGAEYQKIRDWDNQMKLRSEAESFVREPVQMGEDMQLALWEVLDSTQKVQGKIAPIAYGSDYLPGTHCIYAVMQSIPVLRDFAQPSTLGLLNLAVTLGLSAIGFCLLIGFCTRLAALGGVAFLINVCLSQFPWPTVYPYSPDMVGHFMIISKDTVELLALLLIAALPAGRWCGLDWYLWNFFGKYIFAWYGAKKDPLSLD